MLKWPRPPRVPAEPSVGLPPTIARPSCGAMYWKTSCACWRASSVAWLAEVGVPVHCAYDERSAISERPAALRSRALIGVGLLSDDNPTGTANGSSKAPSGHSRAGRAVDDGSGVGVIGDDYHSDAHIERAQQFIPDNLSGLPEHAKEVGDGPSVRFDDRVQVLWQCAVDVTGQPAAG